MRLLSVMILEDLTVGVTALAVLIAILVGLRLLSYAFHRLRAIYVDVARKVTMAYCGRDTSSKLD